MRKSKSKTPSSSPTPKVDLWTTLRVLIGDYVLAHEADSWSGGGDPAEVPVLKAEAELALAKLNAHIEKMEREFEGE